MNLRLMNVLAALTAVVFVAGCGGDSTAPQPGISGNYTATEWVTTGGSGQTNQLTAGSTLNITLTANGTTTGHLHIAASGGNSAFDADMAGTWVQSGGSLTFAQTADTFVRNMTFSVVTNGAAWALVGDQVFSGTRVQLTLTRLGEI